MFEEEWQEPAALLIDTDMASQLERLVALPEKQRCFHSESLVYYVEGYTVVVREFSPGWQPLTTTRFHLPQKADRLTIDTVRVAEFSREALLMVGYGSTLYCWSLKDAGKLLFKSEVVPDEDLAKLSEVHISQETSAVVCCHTRQSAFYMLEVRWLDRLSYPKVVVLRKQASLFKSIGGIPKAFASLWSSPKATDRLDKCFVLTVRGDEAVCLVIRDNLVEKYTVNLKKEPREAVCTSRNDLISRLPEVRTQRIINIWVHLDTNSSAVPRVDFYVASTSPDDELQLTKATRTMDLSSIVNCLDETVKLGIVRYRSIEPFICDRSWLYIVVRNDDNQSQVIKLNQSRLTWKERMNIPGKVVFTNNYQLTESGITRIGAPSVSIEPANEQHGQSYYIAINKQCLLTTPQLTAAISIYNENYADPTDLLEALSRKNTLLSQYIGELERRNLFGVLSEVLFESLKLKLQIVLARNLRDIYDAVLNAAGEDFVGKPMKLFETTNGLQPILQSLAVSQSWRYYLFVLQSVQEFKSAHQEGYPHINEAVLQLVMPALKQRAQLTKIVLEQDRQKEIELFALAVQISPNEEIFYEQLLKANGADICRSLAFSYKHYPILPKLYASPSHTISRADIYNVIEPLSLPLKTEIIQEISRAYLNFLCTRLHQIPQGPLGIRAFEDFSEYDQAIYTMVKVTHPRFAWLLAMKLKRPLHEYLPMMVASIDTMRNGVNRDVMRMISRNFQENIAAPPPPPQQPVQAIDVL